MTEASPAASGSTTVESGAAGEARPDQVSDRRRTARSIAVAGLVVSLAAAGVGGWLLATGDDGPDIDAGVVPEAVTAPFADIDVRSGRVGDGGTPPAARVETADLDVAEASDGSLLDVERDVGPDDESGAPQPARLIIDSLGVNADILGVGVESDGALEIPENVKDVGWYERGATPGQDGSAVLVAHVDSWDQGTGAFFSLHEVPIDAEISIIDTRGGLQRFRVVARREYDKEVLPIDSLFRRDGDSILTLITCGGEFDSRTRAYDSNVVVYAVPI